MKNFLRRNFVLVLGISLPMLLIAALLLVHGISRLTATRPAYPVLYVSFENYFGPHFYDFDIDESGRLEIGFTLAEDADAASNRQPSDAAAAYSSFEMTCRANACSISNSAAPIIDWKVCLRKNIRFEEKTFKN